LLQLREALSRASGRASLFDLFFQQDLGRRSPEACHRWMVQAPASEAVVLPFVEFLVTCLDDPGVARAVLWDFRAALVERGLGDADPMDIAASVGTALGQVLGGAWNLDLASAWSAFEHWVGTTLGDRRWAGEVVQVA